MRAEAQSHIDQINAATALLRRFLDWDRANRRLQELNAKVEDPALWDNPKAAQEVMRERRRLEEAIGATQKIETELKDTIELIEMAELEGDSALVDDGVIALSELADRAERDKVAALLAGEADANNSYIEINAGAGGTESNDWAGMLQRMYSRWAERHGMKVELVDFHAGEQAGIKSATILIKGENAYGNLKVEGGIPASHRSGSIRKSTRTSISRSMNPTCGSTPIARQGRAASTSIRPTARFGLPIFRPGSWSPVRMNDRSTRTGLRLSSS